MSAERIFSCSIGECRKSFKTKGNLKVHMMSHQTDRPFKCVYPGCGKSYINRCRLRTHERIHVIHSILLTLN